MDCIPSLHVIQNCSHLSTILTLNRSYAATTGFTVLCSVIFIIIHLLTMKRVDAILLLLLHFVPGNIILFSYDLTRLTLYRPSPIALGFLESFGMSMIISSIAYIVTIWTNLQKKDLFLRKALDEVEMWSWTAPFFIISTSVIAAVAGYAHYNICYRIVLSLYIIYIVYILFFAVNFYRQKPQIITLVVVAILIVSIIVALLHCIFLSKIENTIWTLIVWSMYRFMSNVYCLMWIGKGIERKVNVRYHISRDFSLQKLSTGST
jgi:hypothetical protein